MIGLIFRYKQLRSVTNNGYTVTAGNYIEVYWDHDVSGFLVYKYTDSTLTSPTTLTDGADIGADRIDYDRVFGGRGRVGGGDYRFCEGTNIVSFRSSSVYPYAQKVTTNSSSCQVGIVCDLAISDTITVVNASDNLTNDGAFEVTASSSNGIIKYSLNPDFDYATDGQLTGSFTGLYAGTFTVTVKDYAGCIDNKTIIVGIPDFYNPKYTLQYYDRNNVQSKIDIFERGYEGDVIEVTGHENDPLILKYNADGEINKFLPIVASELNLKLISGTEFYFRELASTQDDRKYFTSYYKYSNQVIPGFTPAPLDDLSLWIDNGDDWATGSMPSVPEISGLSIYSSILYTFYTFEDGVYSFDYQFKSDGFTWVEINTYSVSGLESSERINVTGTVSGTINISATPSMVKIGFRVRRTPDPQSEFTVISFTNTTPDTSDSIVGLYEKWRGFVISSNYSESYLAAPYGISLVSTDGLADLDKYDFLDSSGNRFSNNISVIKLIAECLRQTDLHLPIVSAINKFEDSMSTSSADDPLAQSYVDASIFYDGDTIKSCKEVLEIILKPFGARIFQRELTWHIVCIEEQVHEYAFRKFDEFGNYSSSGTVSDIINIDYPTLTNRAAFRDAKQVFQNVNAYGDFFFKYNLIANPSLVKSYSFEADDVQLISDDFVIKNWNVNIQNAIGAQIGIKDTKSFEGKSVFFYKPFLNPFDYLDTGTQVYGVNKDNILLTSITGLIEYDTEDLFEFRFSYAILLRIADYSDNIRGTGDDPIWIKLGWSLKIGDYYFNNGIWTTNVLYKYNEIYIDRFNDTAEFKIVAPFRQTDLVTENFTVEFFLTGTNTIEAQDTASGFSSSFTNLKAIPTEDKPIGYKLKSLTIDEPSYIRLVSYYWKLIIKADAPTGSTIKDPDDYDSETNGKTWLLEIRRVVLSSESGALFEDNGRFEKITSYVYVDNVVLKNYPKGEEQVTDITIEKTNNKNIKVDFEDDYYLNDIDIDNINNSERTYKNYFKLSDGSPTQNWTRTYRAGQGKILDLLADDFTNQYKRQSNKLTGRFISDQIIDFTTIMNEANDNDTKYMFMGYELDDKNASINFDLLELKDVVTNDTSIDIDAGFTSGFSLGYRA